MSADRNRPDAAAAPHCTRCRHYWITHERATPHGCRAFGMASVRLPMLDVREASGGDCELFEAKTVEPRK